MQITSFKKENIIRKIDEGVEGIVYLYNDNGKEVALKMFAYNPELYNNNDNKEIKLIILKDEELLQNDIKILNRVYYKDRFIGFTSVYDPYKPMSKIENFNEKIKALKSLQERYEALNKRDIYIGDFNADNFCMTEKGIKLFDVDNYKVGPLDFNVVNVPILMYKKKCRDIKNIDYYCFNYFALSYLANFTTEAVIKGVATPHLPRRFKTPEINQLIYKLEHINDDTKIEKTADGKQKTLLYLLK